MGDEAATVLTTALENITLEDVLSRHRRERKELQAKIQALKKNAPKSDKKKRKEAMEEVSRLEHELEHRQAMEVKAAHTQADNAVNHADEMNGALTGKSESEINDNENGQEEADEDKVAPTRTTKAQKRRDKKAREAQERELEIRAATEQAQNAPKAIELRELMAKLRKRQLTLHHIPSDGDCLYNAIRHQLLQHGLAAPSVQELRHETANYISANKNNCICYMTNPKTGELLNDAEFENYCEVLRTTPAWGGQIELKALSSILKVPIEVLQANGPPTVQSGAECVGPNLVITYHRLLYSLGEHYNSTKPLSADVSDEETENVA